MHAKTILFVAGIAAGIVTGLSSPFGTELAIAALALGAIQVAVYTFARKRETESLALSLFTSIFCFAFFFGIFRAQLIEEKSPYVCYGICTITATIISSPESRDAYQTFVVRPNDIGKGVYDIQVRTSLYPKYEIGEMVKLSGKVKEPDTMFPHGNEKAFDYVSYLHEKNVGSEMLFPKVESAGDGEKAIMVILGRWKENFVERISMYVSSPANTLASGMLFGNSSMSTQLNDTFRIAGLSHIIVLSGFNIAIVIAFILFVFAFLPPMLRVTLAALSVVIFVMMVGGEASVIRATLMSFIALLSMLTGREYVARQALMLSFLAIILYDPAALIDNVSLHLSFLATAGIVYWSEPIKIIVTKFITQNFVVELLTTTLAAYFATLPYIMHTFGMVSVYALLANVLVLPLVPLAMFLSFLTLVATFFSHQLALFFGFIDSAFINIIIAVAETVVKLPGSNLVFQISLTWTCTAYAIIALLIYYFSRMKKDETLLTTPNGYLTDVISY